MYCFCFLDLDNLLLPLLQMEKGEDVNVKQVLLNMRKYRMGLIQTPDQLRFSYMAIIEGAKYTQGDSNIQVNHGHYYQIVSVLGLKAYATATWLNVIIFMCVYMFVFLAKF